MSLMSSSLLLQQCPTCLIRLTWIDFAKGGVWPYSCCFFRVLAPGLVQYFSRHSCVITAKIFFSIRLVSVHVVHPYSSIDTTAIWKKTHFILSVRSNFHVTDSLSIAVHAFASHMLMSFSVDETLLPK